LIHLALWLLSFCIVVAAGIILLALIVGLFGRMWEAVVHAFRSEPPKQAATAPGEVSQETPRWVFAASAVAFFAVCIPAAMIADEMGRRPSPPLAPWFCVVLGVIGGVIVYALVSAHLMSEVVHRRKVKAGLERSREIERQAARQEETLRARQDARVTAITAYPDYLDDDTLLDPYGAYAWPEELFEELFLVPDIVVPFTTKFGDTGEIRLWSKMFVAQQSSEPAYVSYREKLDRERQEEEEQRREEEEERRQVEERERALEDLERKEAEALAARKAQQIIVSVEELKKGR